MFLYRFSPCMADTCIKESIMTTTVLLFLTLLLSYIVRWCVVRHARLPCSIQACCCLHGSARVYTASLCTCSQQEVCICMCGLLPSTVLYYSVFCSGQCLHSVYTHQMHIHTYAGKGLHDCYCLILIPNSCKEDCRATLPQLSPHLIID